MPLQVPPSIDDRTYQQLLDEALARIPVHNPEWTNFNKSDPGVTLLEVSAFLVESLLYRVNQIPERNRRKFLSLLGMTLQPGASARGLVTFANQGGPLQTATLNAGLEVRAGQVPFVTERGLDILPIEAAVYYKRAVPVPTGQLRDYYRQLYASFLDSVPTARELEPYETVPLVPADERGIDLGEAGVDGSLWIALLVRPTDRPFADAVLAARREIAHKTLSLGVVPGLVDATRHLTPGDQEETPGLTLLEVQAPRTDGGRLPPDRLPRYRTLDTVATTNVLVQPGIVDVTLPGPDDLALWEDLDPLEAGVGDFPPSLEDNSLQERVITWLRVRASAGVRARFLWVGVNAAPVTQRVRVTDERLPDGTGEPDQQVALARRPVIPGSVKLTVENNGETQEWAEIDDLMAAGPEVPLPDPALPPGTVAPPNPRRLVFALDAEAGLIRFGDGARGVRPPRGARLRADYAVGLGRAGNVGPGAIATSPALTANDGLPTSIVVSNPVRTWGGAEPETIQEGEKQAASYLQHRDRLVSASDFETIVRRTPGVEIGRVEVLPAFNPELATSEPGDAPGSVTLMLVPTHDPVRPDAPSPDRLFLDAVCSYVDPRRLVTTEVFLRGPAYKSIWVSIGIEVVAGMNAAQVREAVRRALLHLLSPLPAAPGGLDDDPQTFLTTPGLADDRRGWPLRKAIVDRELLAAATRVPGVRLVNGVLLAEGTGSAVTQIPMRGLELPRVDGIFVSSGDPLDLDRARGGPDSAAPPAPERVPVPVIPEECR